MELCPKFRAGMMSEFGLAGTARLRRPRRVQRRNVRGYRVEAQFGPSATTRTVTPWHGVPTELGHYRAEAQLGSAPPNKKPSADCQSATRQANCLRYTELRAT